MRRLKEGASRIVILGGGRGGLAMLEMLCDEPLTEVVAVVDSHHDAPAIMQAQSRGIQVYQDVRTALLENAPCIAFNLTNDEKVDELAYGVLGAGSVIGGLEAKLFWRMVTDLKEAKKDLEYQATHDSLTGLYNRRFMMSQMHREISQTIRYGHHCSLVLIDLDCFKKVNDNYGHVVGDFVLQQVAQHLKETVRATDILGRWGGEEFIVLLPHTSAIDARLAAVQWLEHVQRTPVVLANGEQLGVSFSAGVAEVLVTDGESAVEHIEALLGRVDGYLYKAKGSGRGCVVGDVNE